MRHVPFIDSTGIHRLKEIIRQFENRKVSVILSGVNQQVRLDLEKSEIYDVLNKDNLHNNIDSSLVRAKEILKK